MEHYKKEPVTHPLEKVTEPLEIFDKVHFFETLTAQGYSKKQIGKVRNGLNHLNTQISIEELIENLSDSQYLKELSTTLKRVFSTDIAKNALTASHRVKDYLIERGLLSELPYLRTSGQFTKAEKQLQSYVGIEKNYGLQQADRYLREYQRLTNHLNDNGIKNLSKVTSREIFNYHSTLGKSNTVRCVNRRVLRFLFREGFLKDDFGPLILSNRRRSNTVRRFLDLSSINQLLSTIDRSTVKGKRDFLFFLLMNRLALRGKEITRIKIQDFDFRNSRIFIEGKHDLMIQMPFSNEIGEAALDWLKHAPRFNSEHLIVSLKPPFRPLKEPTCFNKTLHEMYRVSGVICPTKKICINVMRHSRGTHDLNSGSEISDVQKFMRHEHVATTMIYAKYNINSLRSLAVEWPGGNQ